jgi:hypothetical protein
MRPAAGLGKEGFRIAHGDGALYLWRTANLVLSTEIDCTDGPCGFDVAAAARAYADAVSNRARTT